MLALFHVDPGGSERLLHERAGLELVEFEYYAPGFQPGYFQQVGDQPGEAVDIVVDDLDELCLLVGELAADAHRQHLAIALYGGHGLLQLVGHKVYELQLGLFEFGRAVDQIAVLDGQGGLIDQGSEDVQIVGRVGYAGWTRPKGEPTHRGIRRNASTPPQGDEKHQALAVQRWWGLAVTA